MSALKSGQPLIENISSPSEALLGSITNQRNILLTKTHKL